jgi:hypothetical protein
MAKNIILDFGVFTLDAELFDSSIADKFYQNLPYSIELTTWGKEVYGPIEHSLGFEKPQGSIPEGGIAYTSRGNYVCVFFGQTPAWPVEYIGQIKETSWEKLLTASLRNLTITKSAD